MSLKETAVELIKQGKTLKVGDALHKFEDLNMSQPCEVHEYAAGEWLYIFFYSPALWGLFDYRRHPRNKKGEWKK